MKAERRAGERFESDISTNQYIDTRASSTEKAGNYPVLSVPVRTASTKITWLPVWWSGIRAYIAASTLCSRTWRDLNALELVPALICDGILVAHFRVKLSKADRQGMDFLCVMQEDYGPVWTRWFIDLEQQQRSVWHPREPGSIWEEQKKRKAEMSDKWSRDCIFSSNFSW